MLKFDLIQQYQPYKIKLYTPQKNIQFLRKLNRCHTICCGGCGFMTLSHTSHFFPKFVIKKKVFNIYHVFSCKMLLLALVKMNGGPSMRTAHNLSRRNYLSHFVNQRWQKSKTRWEIVRCPTIDKFPTGAQVQRMQGIKQETRTRQEANKTLPCNAG